MAYDEMTTHVPRAVLIGNGSRGPYTLNDSGGNPIRVRTHSHLVVRRYSSVTDEVGTALALNTDYTVTNTDVDAVTITLTSAQAVVASTERLVVTRLQSLADVISLSSGGNFSAEALSAAMSVLTEELQETRRDVDRSIKPSWRNTVTPSLPIAPSATKLLGHTSDDTLAHVEVATISPTGVTLGAGWSTVLGLAAPGSLDDLAGIRFVATYAALTALVAATGLADNAVYYTYGRTAEEDGGAGFWRYDSASTATANGGTILAIDGGGAGRFFRLYEGNMVQAKWFGVKSDNATDDITALQLATNTGKLVELDSGTTTIISSGIDHVAGSGLICKGRATLKAKTGSGGFNITTLAAPRTALDRNMYRTNQTDDVTIRNIHFTTDGANQRYINAIRLYGGMATEGYDISNVSFSGFAASQIITVSSLGSGRRRNIHIASAKDCGITLGTASWTGTPQTTVMEIDNDLISSTASKPGKIRIDFVKDILFSGSALTDFGQQTDVFNIISQGANSTSGWDVEIGTVDGVGEVVDLQGFACNVRVGYLKNIYNDAVKLIHGASYNNVDVGVIEACGRSAVGIFGSAEVTTDRNTTGNTIRVGTVRLPGTYGLGTSGTTAIVLFGNANSTYKPTLNRVIIDNFIGDGTNLDYGVSDGGSDANNFNEVTIGRGTGFAIASCLAPPTNVRVRCLQRSITEMTMSASQSVANATNTTLALNTAGTDTESAAVTGSNKVRVVWPGLYHVTGAVRWSGTNLNDGEWAQNRILQNTVTMSQATVNASAAAQEPVGMPTTTIYVDENDMVGVNADLSIQVRVASAANRDISAAITKLTVVRVG